MVGVVVRLKVALVRNAIATGRLGRAVYALTWLGGLALAAAGFAQLARVRTLAPAGGGPFLVVAFTAIFATWLAVPLMTGGAGDQAVDPSRFELLPITQRQKAVGMLAAAFVGVGPVATLLGLLGAAPGYARDLATVAVAVTAAALLTVLCVTASRALATSLAAALRTRRGRDAALLATGLVAVAAYVVLPRQRDPGALVRLRPSALTATLAALPPGALARAVVAARDGRLGVAVLLLAYGALAVSAALALFGAALGREVVQRGDRSVVRGGDTRLPLFPRPLRWLPADPVGAVTAKELRYFLSRDPRQLQMLVFGGAVAAVTLWQSVASGDPVIGQVAGPLLVVLLGAQSLGNQFGVDADAVQHYQLAGVRMRSVLGGKNLAVLLLLAPVTFAAQAVVAALTHGFGRLPGALACAAGTLGVLAGFGDLLSVRAAYPIARGDARPSGRQATTALVGVIGVFCSLVLAVPLLGLMVWSDLALGTNLPGGIAALALGTAGWWFGLSRAARWADRHGPELAAKLHLGQP